MDFEDITRAALAARSFSHALDGERIAVSLLLPTPHEAEVAAVRHRLGPDGRPDGAAAVRTVRQLLEQAIVGWQGVTVRDLLPADAPAEPDQAGQAVPWAPALVPLLLDAQPAWQMELHRHLFERIEQRNAARDTAAKNSSSASSGRSPAPRRRR